MKQTSNTFNPLFFSGYHGVPSYQQTLIFYREEGSWVTDKERVKDDTQKGIKLVKSDAMVKIWPVTAILIDQYSS